MGLPPLGLCSDGSTWDKVRKVGLARAPNIGKVHGREGGLAPASFAEFLYPEI